MAQRPARDGRPAWLGAAETLYDAALRLYPRGFRERWGDAMRQAFRDRCREVARGERNGFALLHESIADLAAGAGRERIHAMEGMPVSKRNWMLVLLFAFAAMLAMHDRLGTAGTAAMDWWKQRQESLDNAAAARFYRDAGTGLERAATGPRDHALAALLLARAHDLAAQGEWQQAIDARDPLALWISAVDCPVASCDRKMAVAELARIEPANAAIGQFEMNIAAEAGDQQAMRGALQRMAAAGLHDGHEAELAKGLLRAVDGVGVPRRLLRFGDGVQGQQAVRTLLATGIWMLVAQPAYGNFSGMCRKDAAADVVEDCVAAARIMADGNTLIARSIGLRVWYRLATTDGEREGILERLREDRWLMDNLGAVFNADTADGLLRWRDARLRTPNEIEAFRLLERERGVPGTPPASFRPDAAALLGR